MIYALVENDEVVSVNIERPNKVGNVYIGKNTDLKKFGLFPQLARDGSEYSHNVTTKNTEFDGEVVHVDYVPASVSARQGMEQLIREGLDEQVFAAVDAIEDPLERKLTRNWLDKAGEWEKDNTQLRSMGYALELTDDQIDDLLISASKL